MSKSLKFLLGSALGLTVLAAPASAETLGLGRAALPEEIAAWDVTVLPDGTGLPEGAGDVAMGDEVFAEKCASCHGDFAEGIDNWPVLAGGQDSLRNPRPVKTVGSYWPYLSTVFDYIHRSMPFGAAQTVTPDEAYAITAFLLYSNGIVEDDFVLSKETYASITMPNAEGFYVDDRPEVEYPQFSGAACMKDCAAEVKITKRAVDLKVTPTDPDGLPAGTLPDLHLAAAGGAVPAADAPAAEAPATETAAPADGPAPTLVEAGAKVFKKCAACHKVGEDAENATGPELNDLIGRTAGSLDGFKYSKSMADAGTGGLVWSDETLHDYLANPKAYVKGTKMSFAGLKSKDDIDAVIAYLKSAGG